MNNHQRIVAAVVILFLIPSGDLVAALQAASPPMQSTSRSSGSSNHAQARRIVMHLGVGQRAALKLTSGETLQGSIREIADDHFVLLLDQTSVLIVVAYDDVRQIGPVIVNPVRTRKRWNAGTIVAIAGFAAYALANIWQCRGGRACG